MAWIFKRSIWKRMTGGSLGGSWEEESFRKVPLPTGFADVDDSLVTKSALRSVVTSWDGKRANGLSVGERMTFPILVVPVPGRCRVRENSLIPLTFLPVSPPVSPPQANDLYGVWGNPSLDSEEAKSWEVGLKGTRMDWRLAS